MDVFISSVVQGFEAFREAVGSGITALGHRAIRAEDFGASPESPQSACLAGVRAADAVILILGDRYGHVQASGLSATHEEYREAKDTRPVIVLIRQGVEPEPQQAAFIGEVQSWEHGYFTGEFSDEVELRDKVIRAMHDYELAGAPLDEVEIVERAKALIPVPRNSAGTDLAVVVAGGPLRPLLRPAELESVDLRQFLMAEALTGSDAVLTPERGTGYAIRADTVQLIQEHGAGLVTLSETGSCSRR